MRSELGRVRLVALPCAMTQSIHQAMRTRRHHLFDMQDLPALVYNAHITLCCNTLATYTDTRSYGNRNLTYRQNRHYFACCQKRVKRRADNAEEEESDDAASLIAPDDDIIVVEEEEEEEEQQQPEELDDDIAAILEHKKKREANSEDAKRAAFVRNAIFNLNTGKLGSLDKYNTLPVKVAMPCALSLSLLFSPIVFFFTGTTHDCTSPGQLHYATALHVQAASSDLQPPRPAPLLWGREQ